MSIRIPVLGYRNPPMEGDPEAARIIVGMGDLTLDGKAFPWPTVGDWTVTFSDDSLATLTVRIPVSLPRDPATEVG